MKYQNYLTSLTFLTLVIVTAGSTLIFLSDPYGIFGAPRIKDFNARKPAAENRVRISKPLQVEHIKPKTIIIGNSRPEMGLNPAHSCWKQDKLPVYNLSIPGSSVYMQTRFLEHAISLSNATTILMGIDFQDFLVTKHNSLSPYIWPPGKTSFDAKLSINPNGSINTKYSYEKYKTYINNILSLDSLKDSIITLQQQANSSSTHRTSLGFNPANNYYMNIINNEGVNVLFTQKKRALKKVFLKNSWSIYHQNTQWSSAFESLSRVIKLTKRKGIKLYLFINPYHQDYLNIINSAGLWPAFKLWKENLKQLVYAESHISLWDFALYNQYTQEMPDLQNPKKQLNWFWEPSHYREKLGEIMLSNMLDDPCFYDAKSKAGLQLK